MKTRKDASNKMRAWQRKKFTKHTHNFHNALILSEGFISPWKWYSAFIFFFQLCLASELPHPFPHTCLQLGKQLCATSLGQATRRPGWMGSSTAWSSVWNWVSLKVPSSLSHFRFYDHYSPTRNRLSSRLHVLLKHQKRQIRKALWICQLCCLPAEHR